MGHSNRIERLAFSSFRGATTPVEFQFDPAQSIVLIFGENGTGKSTVADALDFICNQSLGSVRLRSGTKSGHIVSSEAQGRDLAVELCFGGDVWQASLRSNKPIVTPPQPPQAFVLRRADITRVTESTDSERYKALQNFITVPQIESSEKTLRTLCKTVSDELDRESSRKINSEGTLQNFWEAEGKPAESYLVWAREAVQQSIAELTTQMSSDKEVLAYLNQTASAKARLESAEKNLAQAQVDHIELEQQMQQFSHTQANAELVSTLTEVQTYLQNHQEIDACPICSKPEPHDSLLNQVHAQLKQLSQVQQLHQRIKKAETTFLQTDGEFNAAKKAFSDAYTSLFDTLDRRSKVSTSSITIAPKDSAIEAIEVTLQQLAMYQTALEKRVEDAQKKINQHSALKTHLATIDELSATTKEKYALLQRLQAMFQVVEAKRKNYVQQVVDSISGTVDALYNFIHPDEPLGNPSFNLKDKGRGSLTLTSRFGNTNGIPPSAYYSEAHLDTLGLCVYLALAKHSGNALVVLDDVLMSVDDPHLDRIIELINNEAKNFGHVIITTHSRAWFDRMRLGHGMRAELIELYGWTMEGGIKHSRALLAVEELRAVVHASKLDRQSVASQAGILLEQLLDTLTLQFGCRLARKRRPEYTLSELAGSINKNLRKLLRVEHIDAADNVASDQALSQLITDCTQDVWIRNQVGAHFNEKAAGISDAMVKQFGERVLTFADALLCSTCHQLPRQNKSGSYWQCGGGCGKVRLYPLISD